MKKILSIFTVLFTSLTFGQNVDPYLQPNSSPSSGQWNKGTLQVDGDFVLPTTLNSFTNPSLRDYGKLMYDTTDSIPKFHNGNEWVSLIQDLQSVTTKGNTTTNPIGIAADSINSNVALLKIGNGIPTDANNIVAVTHEYDVNTGTVPSVGNNGLNVELYATAQEDFNGRAARAVKGVAFVNPNGYTLSNDGGAGIGLEGVTRMNGLGTAEVLTGGYFAIIQEVDDPASIIGSANGIVIRGVGGFSTNPIQRVSGLTINEQNYLSRATNTANIALTGDNNLGEIPTSMLGKFSIWNNSVEKNYHKGLSGFGTNNPTAQVHVESTTTPQVSIGYDSTNKANISVGSTGNLTLTSSGSQVNITNTTFIGSGSLSTLTPASGSFTPQFGAGATTGAVGISVNLSDGSNNPRSGLYINSTEWGLTHAASSSRLPFIIRSGNNNHFEISTAGKTKINVAPDTSAGTYDIITRNTSTGVLEKVTSSTFAPLVSPTFTGDPKAPTPTAGDNDTSIATTAFVTSAISTADATYVKISGAQTIAGEKTFSDIPIVGTADALDFSDKAASTGYVDLADAVKVDKVGDDDIEITDPTKGLILEDTVTGTRYRIQITSGVITANALP